MAIEEYFAYDSFRPNQRDLAVHISERCVAGGILLTEAMSGFGKTAAVLCGALSAARQTGCRVVYACRTKRQILRVSEELALLQKKQRLKAASMFSKFDYCLLKKRSSRVVPQDSFAWYCGFNVTNNLCSYFMNVALLNEELESAVKQVSESIPMHEDLLRQSEDLHVCPYELTRLALIQAEVVVVPYHYVFDPRSKPRLLEGSGLEPRKTILIVDEAHNIRDFLRGIRSGALGFQELQGAIGEAEELMMERTAGSLRLLSERVRRELEAISGWYLDRASFVERVQQGQDDTWLQNLAFELNACSEAAWHSVAYGRRLPVLVLKVGSFFEKLLTASPNTILTKWDQTLGLVDTNPVENFAQFLNEFHSSVLVSATINPSELFLRSIGVDQASSNTYVVQSAPTVTVKTIIDTGVTTKYKLRSPEMYSKIAHRIAAVSSCLTNGVGVFAPSYSVLEPIYDSVARLLPEKTVLCERRGMTTQDANDTMHTFMAQRGALLCGVQGGRFSEGEDFKGDAMDATMVVGLSLPPPSPQLYAEYTFQKWRGNTDSYLMLSLLPALRKAFQAAGRHIRRPGKKGLVFLLDHRFDSSAVTELMPSWMKTDVVRGNIAPGMLGSVIGDFGRDSGSVP